MSWIDVELRVFGLEVRRDRLRVSRLIVSGLVKTYGEGADRAARLGLHQRDYCRRIDSTREKRSEGNVRLQSKLHGVAQQSVELLHCFLWRNLERFGQGFAGDLSSRPVAM